ncbi:unnamed protein product [Aphanomyces euteiches]|uniref:Uncharacterized protein n=1 Tax=Aphanomyces euteiches TaxID=100861 RepID=A0A6G0XDK5_9STRA|nr:hypothetical protein Ae201684_006168 [Aphanomyces euteiches]KAH9068815.1 hypothetical protein Ae201684P_004514 [Aphanomyces euteiches]KAH9134232.1 hypothetical protein AeRB84_019947 [Aphanomyces euteiches]
MGFNPAKSQGCRRVNSNSTAASAPSLNELSFIKSILKAKPPARFQDRVRPISQTPQRYLTRMEVVAGKRVPFTTALAKLVRQHSSSSLATIEETYKKTNKTHGWSAYMSTILHSFHRSV